MAAHRHKWRETIWSLEGPLMLLVECMTCLKTEHFRPRKRLRKPPEGMSEERFEAYKIVAEEPELLEAFRDRLTTASPLQMNEAWSKGIVPPLPNFDNLDTYLERTAARRRKAA